MQGMSLVPAVTELVAAEMMWLQYQDPNTPISFYINSLGCAVRSLLGTCRTLCLLLKHKAQPSTLNLQHSLYRRPSSG